MKVGRRVLYFFLVKWGRGEGVALDIRKLLLHYYILYICMKAGPHKVSSLGFLHKTHLANFTIFMSDM